MRRTIIFVIAILLPLFSFGHTSAQTEPTRQEILRGSITPERAWWDVLHYHLQVEFMPETKRLQGSNTITFKTVKAGSKMQIDLQPPLAITKVTHVNEQLKFERE